MDLNKCTENTSDKNKRRPSFFNFENSSDEDDGKKKIDYVEKIDFVKVKRRSSFFNIEATSDKSDSEKKFDYVAKLNQEKTDWIELIRRTNGKIRE